MPLPNCETIIEVNLHRFKEGARVLEDIARFILQDLNLFKQIKELKHQVKINNISSLKRLDKDIGGVNYQENNSRNNILDITNANALRMQEAARVLEEVCDAQQFKILRFKAYAIYYELLDKLKGWMNKKQLAGIYPICNPGTHSIQEMANYINRSGVKLCQLRMKKENQAEIYHYAKVFKSLLNQEVLLIINDYLSIALLCADGIHLGQEDIPVQAVRAITKGSFVIGASCHNLQEAKLAKRQGASYISVGCLFPSRTKPNTIKTSLLTLSEIRKHVDLPLCAIGGIGINQIEKLTHLGVDMIAMQSGIWDKKR